MNARRTPADDAALAADTLPRPVVATPACHHCGEPTPAVPVVAVVRGVRHAFCCSGCAAAGAWIDEAGLADYYRLRSAEAVRVEPDAADLSAWDRDDVQAGHVVEADGGRAVTVVVDGMRCAACAWLIDRALAREPGVLSAGANAVTGRVRIAWDPQATRLSALLTRLQALGYRPHLAGGDALERERRRERNRFIARLGVALLGALQAMMYAEALYLDDAGEMSTALRDLFRWIAFLVSTPVVFFSGWPFLAGMVRELRARAPAMDTLVGGSVLLAYGASLVQTVRGGDVVWFDAAVMFVLFLLFARFLETRARQHASASLDLLARARPALAWRQRGGVREQVTVAALMPGDVLLVAAGEAVAADGALLDAAAFDESLLTGESLPVHKPAGAIAYAGSVCREASARLRVVRTGTDTRLSQLVRLVERAQAQRPRLARLADRVASRFVVALLLVAAGVFGAWYVAAGPARAFEIALAVLVVSCPCALSLAVPAALASAHSTLARRGVLVLADDALEALARVDTVVFDKTGTLTRGQPRLLATQVFADVDAATARDVAASLEAGTAHPLSAAFGPGTRTPDGPVRTHAGCGLEGELGGATWRLGRATFAVGDGGDGEDGAIVLSRDGIAVARFTVADEPRDDAGPAIAALRADGFEVRVLSGDGHAAVGTLAARLQLDAAAARQSPEDKLATVRALQAEGRRVLMVGDGLNDAPVLAGADVSIALAGGADLAQRAASLVVVADALDRIGESIALARRARRIVAQNLGWAVAYNLVALPFAALGMIGPGLAAAGMAASSLLVTANALRLGRAARPGTSAQTRAIASRDRLDRPAAPR